MMKTPAENVKIKIFTSIDRHSPFIFRRLESPLYTPTFGAEDQSTPVGGAMLWPGPLWPTDRPVCEVTEWTSVAKPQTAEKDASYLESPVLPSFHSPSKDVSSWSHPPSVEMSRLEAQETSETSEERVLPGEAISVPASVRVASQSEADEQETLCGDDITDVDTKRLGPIELKPRQLIGTLGRGAFGDVLLGFLGSGTFVAVKVVHKPKMYRVPGARKILLREHEILRIVALKGFKFVTPLVSSWEDEENVYFTMVRCSFFYLLRKFI